MNYLATHHRRAQTSVHPSRRAEFDYGFVVRPRVGRTEKGLRQRRAAEAFHPDGLIENSISHSNVRRVAFEFEGERSILDEKRHEGLEFVIRKSVKKWALSVVVDACIGFCSVIREYGRTRIQQMKISLSHKRWELCGAAERVFYQTGLTEPEPLTGEIAMPAFSRSHRSL